MFASQEGKSIPQVTFHTRQGDSWVDVTTDELFKDKTVIVFSLPGLLLLPAPPATCRAITNSRMCSKNMEWTVSCASRLTILL
ncbi:hypothetical protein ERHA55_49900 [Erwinia rhapontici]|nr:hypothetical protein ERHA55_49900 [Erwinia rhapontici]